jgi:hypothetical protein
VPGCLVDQACGWCLRSCRLQARQALVESVDCWPMAIIIHKTLGGKPKPITASGVIGRRYPPPEKCMLYTVITLWCLSSSIADHFLGNSVGAIG